MNSYNLQQGAVFYPNYLKSDKTTIFAHAVFIENYMTTKGTLRKLQAIGKANGWDIIREVGTLNNAPVYQLIRSGLPPRAKLGMPHLYSVNKSGIFELSLDDAHKVIAMESFKSGGKRLQ